MDVCRIFQEKFGEVTLSTALQILRDNTKRIVLLKSENEEKMALSMAILNFLKASSGEKAVAMHGMFKDKYSYLREIMINEDLFSAQVINELPIDVENTLLGYNIENMMDCL